MRRLGFGYEERFPAGAGATLIVVALPIALRVRMNPLLLGGRCGSRQVSHGFVTSMSNLSKSRTLRVATDKS